MSGAVPEGTRGAPGWTGLFGAPLVLAVGIAAGWLVYERPEPVQDLHGEAFSTGKVMGWLPHVAQEPRPVGSEHHDRVRRWLVAEIADLGLAPTMQAGTRQGAMLTNVVVRLPGNDHSRALLLASHYDSRPDTPGAADDAVSSAVLLEVLTRLAREPALENDLIFLFTDGEELDLLGARLFVEEHPWMADVAAVLNFDNIGNDGPVVMFQTGPGSAALVEAYAANAPHPVTSSLAPAVYERLPNDTDFTPFLELGLPGLNLAIVGGGSAYHDPSDTYQSIDHGTIQLQGETALALARAIGNLDLAGLERGDLTYFDVLARYVLRYGLLVTLVVSVGALALVGAAVVFGCARFGLRTVDLLMAGCVYVAFLVGSALLGFLLWLAVHWITGLFTTAVTPVSNLTSASWTLGGLAGFAAFTSITMLERLKRGTNDDPFAGGFVISGLAIWVVPLVLLIPADLYSGAQLTVAVAIAAGAFLFGRGRAGGFFLFVGAVAVAVVLAPLVVLTFHLLSKNLAKSVLVGSILLSMSMGLFAPYLACVTHPRALRLLIGIGSVGALVQGALLQAHGM